MAGGVFFVSMLNAKEFSPRHDECRGGKDTFMYVSACLRGSDLDYRYEQTAF